MEEDPKEPNQTETQPERFCDVCGALALGEITVTCNRCGKARTNFYCQRHYDEHVVTKVWYCENCMRKRGRPGGKKKRHNAGRDDAKLNPVGTGKVKYIPPREARRLPSRSRNRASCPKSSDSCPVVEVRGPNTNIILPEQSLRGSNFPAVWTTWKGCSKFLNTTRLRPAKRERIPQKHDFADGKCSKTVD